MSTMLDPAATTALLEKFDLAGRTPHVERANGAAHPGILATIECFQNTEHDAHIEVTIGAHVAKRVLPLSAFEAETIAQEFAAEHLLPSEPAVRNMVAHVFEHCSDLVTENAPISRVLCTNLHIRPSDYEIDTVNVWVTSPLHVKPRLAKDAHDRKASFGTRGGSEKRS